VVDDRGSVELIPYELCVLVALRDALRRREIYVRGAHRWRDPDDDLPGDFDTTREVHYAWNSGNTVIFYGKDGDLTGPDREHAETWMLALHLLQSALVYLLTELSGEVSLIRSRGESRRAMVPAHDRQGRAEPGSRVVDRAAGRRVGRDRGPVGTVAAA
jgi:hypothetical protein